MTTLDRIMPKFRWGNVVPTAMGNRVRRGPGYQFSDELNETPFEQGILGMANAGPNTNGSQFYLMLDEASHLTGRYTAFGKIEEGLDVLLALKERDPATASEPGEVINTIEIVEG